MIHQFDEEGFRFRYPENWKVEREESDTRWTVTVQSPDTAFMMLTVDAEMPEVQDVATTALDALKEDYPDLEAEVSEEDLAGQPSFGHEIRFFSFDFLNTCWTRSFYSTARHRVAVVPDQRPGKQRAHFAGDMCFPGGGRRSESAQTSASASRRRGDRLLDVFFGVGRRQERRLELAARQINAAVHHRPEEAGEAGGVALLGRVVIGHRLGGEEQRPHAADAGDLVRHARPSPRPRSSPSASLLAQLLQPRVRRVVAQFLQRRQPGGHGQRVARQRAGLEDRPGGHDLLMMSARPPYAPTGRPPPTILPSTVRSGFCFEQLLRTAEARRKPVITSS